MKMRKNLKFRILRILKYKELLIKIRNGKEEILKKCLKL